MLPHDELISEDVIMKGYRKALFFDLTKGNICRHLKSQWEENRIVQSRGRESKCYLQFRLADLS